jgi:anti-anti-sigma factor
MSDLVRPAATPLRDASHVLAPRFSGRRYRTRGWPCRRPSVFGILVVYARVDVLLQLSGRLDAEGSQSFDECVAAAIAEHPRRIRIDCSSLDAVDPASAGCFVRAHRRAAESHVQLTLDAPNPDVERVLRDAAVFDCLMVR